MINNHMPSFKEKASCEDHDPDLWFPEEKGGNNRSWSRTPDAMKARAICKDCPALMECKAYSLAYDGLAGIWGGLDKVERRELQRKLGITPIHMMKTYDHTMFVGGVLSE